MADTTSGLVTFDGENPLNGDSIFDGNMARLDLMARDYLLFYFPGDAQTGAPFDGHILPYDCVIEAAIFKTYQGKPSGQNLVAVVLVNSVESTRFTMNVATAGYIQKVAALGTHTASAGQKIEMQFAAVGTTNAGYNVAVVLQVRKVVTG